jgi:dipeptidyl aminopeptidase/acylaminoacyl peptidase
MGCLLATAERPGEVAVLEVGREAEPRLLTGLNDAFFKEVETSRPTDFWVTAEDGWKTHAWLMLPPKHARRTARRGRLPAVLEIHGGPHAAYGWAFFHEFQCLAAQGYAVVYGNPRGSKGYGEAHAQAITGRWGDRDWADVSALVGWTRGRRDLDPRRLGVMGGSYGGYMTNWAVGHTRAFKAAVTDRCVSNMVSMTGTSDYPFGVGSYWPGSPWGSLEDIAPLWKSSPIAHFDGVKTPMLVIHSEGDLRCNIEQAEQVFTALQVRGVESRFVRYPATTSHGLSRGGPPDLRVHRLGEILRWWRRHLG